MYSKIHSAVVFGIDGLCIEIEVGVAKGLPSYQIVGLPAKTIRESKERIRSGIESLGIKFPAKRITLNLIPAEVPKDGSHLDLPMAVGVLEAVGEVRTDFIKDMALFGEMTLDGRLMPVLGILSMVIALKNKGIKHIVVPTEMVAEVGMIDGVSCFGASNLSDVVELLKSENPLEKFVNVKPKIEERVKKDHLPDYSEVIGQEVAKRALVISAAGFHNIIISGPPGSGKTMMMRAFENIIPQLSIQDAVEVRKIQSLSDQGVTSALSLSRPVRKPHHHITPVSMIGGGMKVRPGELTLAHRGVLFLDELPEFKREVLESLRQPLEDQCVRLSRLHNKVLMPTKILFAATMNPCKCGYLYSLDKVCTCSDREISNYLGRLSGPLLDRIDILLEVQRGADEENKTSQLSTKDMLRLVSGAVEIQNKRFKGTSIQFNSEMKASHIKSLCNLTSEAETLFKQSADTFKFSKRVKDKILKLSRTIADVDGSVNIGVPHLAEAIQYRLAQGRLRGE